MNRFKIFVKSTLGIFLIFLCSQSKAQNNEDSGLNYPKSVIKTLTSEEFAGRGYTHNGMEKAAGYLAAEFKKIGLEKIGDSYFQVFSMPINVIEDAKLKINGRELKYGIDFLVRPSSKSQNFNKKEFYLINPEKFEMALSSKQNLIEFIAEDTDLQKNKHILFPARKFKVDSVNNYYKDWANLYKPEENRNRAIFFFTNTNKMTASLSMKQDSISEFFIKEGFYSNNLKIDDYKIESRFVSDFLAKNIIGKIEGENPDSLIVVTAHYDHLGKVGETMFPGASDNASGIAFLLDLASYFVNHKPKYTLIFICFAAEEAGMLGSNYFVKNPVIELKKIKFLLNFDIMGAGDEGIQIVNSSVFTKEFDLINHINQQKMLIPLIKKRGEACNSDHCPFYEAGIPSFFTYTMGGPGFYHDPMDSAETLNLMGFLNLKELFIDFINSL